MIYSKEDVKKILNEIRKVPKFTYETGRWKDEYEAIDPKDLEKKLKEIEKKL